jgi:hypothetical protein
MGGMQTATPADTLADLAAAYTAWHIWRGRDGRGADKGWYATRRRRLSPPELHAGLAARLSADDLDSLRSLLAQHLVIEERALKAA